MRNNTFYVLNISFLFFRGLYFEEDILIFPQLFILKEFIATENLKEVYYFFFKNMNYASQAGIFVLARTN